MSQRRLDPLSFLCGAACSLGCALVLALGGTAEAFDLGKVGDLANTVKNSVSSLVNIKKNLDSDVKNLTGDAKTLMGDKDKLLQIKDQLFQLSKQTKDQVDLISKLVGEVEGHLKQTQTNISSTSQHVGEIDKVRKDLSGK